MKRFGALTQFFIIIFIGGTLLGLCLATLAPALGMVAKAHNGTDNIDIALSDLSSRTIVVDAKGNEIGRLGLEDRDPVKLDEVPEIMQTAVVLAEDRTFWENPGIDARAIARAATSNVSLGSVNQGGSTITQQLVKNRLLTNEKTFSRKIKEAVLAYRLTERYSKTEILQEYLNTVYFGQGSYGIKAASERFFKKPLADLTIAEAALLAGVIPNPESWNPFTYPDRAKNRRAVILKVLKDEGVITAEQEAEANAAPLPTEKPSAELRPQTYLVAEAQRLLLDDERLGETAQERYNKVLRGGLKIHTSYDPDLQKMAQDAVDSKLPNQPPFTAAMVVMDRNTGKVLAMVGGPGFEDATFNLATQGKRQTGSTFKAIGMTAALNEGFSPNDTVSGSSPCTVRIDGHAPWETNNYAGGGSGTTSLTRAMAGSVNCAFARLIGAVGVSKTAEMAERLGVNHDVPEFPSISLGTDETTPLDMTTVYNTLSTGGIRHNPVFVTKVEGPNGEIIFEEKYEGTRVLGENVAYSVVDTLRGVINSGTGTGARVPGHDAVGKTGTTDNFGDAWFCGMTMKYTSCVWMGNPAARTPMTNVGGRSVSGGSFPASIWRAFMIPAMATQDAQKFPAPDKSKWPSPKFFTEAGRGTERPPEEGIAEFQRSSTTTTVATRPPSTTTTTTSTFPPATTIPDDDD